MALIKVLRVGLKTEVQRPVGQTAEPAAEELVQRTGKDHRPGERLPVQQKRVPQSEQSGGVRAQLHRDVGVVQQTLKNGGVAVQGHPLPGVLEVTAVPGEENGHPGGGVRVDLLRPLSPLLHGVADKDMVVDIVCQSRDLRIGVGPQLQDRDLFFRPVSRNEFSCQFSRLLGTEGGLQGDEIEGHGQLHPPAGSRDAGRYLVAIIPPVGVLREVVIDPPVRGMEDMGAVLVDEDAAGVEAVVSVSAHMVPLFQHQHPSVPPAGQFSGGHRPGEAGADDQTVIVCHIVLLVFRFQDYFNTGHGVRKERMS